MKRQKHYGSEEAILRDIDRCKYNIEKMGRDADILDGIADEMYKLQNPSFLEDAAMKRKAAQNKRASAYRMTHTRMKRLSDTLAAFRTPVLNGIVPDNSVTLEAKRS